MTRRTPTERQRDTRARKRAAGLQRRTVWLSEGAIFRLREVMALKQMTQDQAIHYCIGMGRAHS